MSYLVAYHPEVDGDLREIERWLDRFSDPGTATRRLGQIATTINSLADYPHACAIREDVAPNLRVVPSAEGKAVLTFVVDDDVREVLILAATYGGTDWIGRSQSRLKV